jgi:transcriptional regulator with XRE-family HTH domain
MTWVPTPKAVRKLRQAAKLEQHELARKAGLSERAIRLLESRRAPKTMYATTVKALAGALKCAPEDLATWVARGRGGDAREDVESLVALPPASTLARRAKREQELGRAQEIVRVGDRDYELVGPTLLKRCFTACATVQDRVFAVSGAVKDYQALPQRAAAVLGARVGHGARFLLARTVAKGVPFYVTVFTRNLRHTERLIALGEENQATTVIVRLVVAEPEGGWKGFFIFEKKPKPHAFALVVET